MLDIYQVDAHIKNLYSLLKCKQKSLPCPSGDCSETLFLNQCLEWVEGGGGVNIYNSNGNLTANRTVIQAGFDLSFENTNSAIRNGAILGGSSQGASLEFGDGTNSFVVAVDNAQSSLIWIDNAGGVKQGNATVSGTASAIGRMVSATQRHEYYADDNISEIEIVDDQFGGAVQLAALQLNNLSPGVYESYWSVKSGYTDDDDYITSGVNLTASEISLYVLEPTVAGVVGIPANQFTLNAAEAGFTYLAGNGVGVAGVDNDGNLFWSAGSGWALTGNSGLTDGVDNFFGTTTNIPINFLVNNVTAGRLENSTNGLSNTFFGYESGLVNSTGHDNIALGLGALSTNVSGNNNIAIGNTSTIGGNAVDNTIAIGHNTLTSANGDDCIVVGNNSFANTGGDNNIGIGHGCEAGAFVNSIVLGTNSGVTADNQFALGTQTNLNFASVVNIKTGALVAFDDDADAGGGGLTTGDWYQTTGSGAAPLNVAGIVMIKQ